MVSIVPPNAESREVANYLTELEMRMKRVEAGLRTAQLGHSSLNGSGIPMFDASGNYRGTVGFQDDGTTTVTSKNPVPPPIPSGPQVTPAIGTLIVSHTGETATPDPNPADFSHLNVYTATVGLPDILTLRGTINPVPGEFPIPGLDYNTYLVYVTAVNMGGTESAPSIPTSGTPYQVEGPDIAANAIQATHISAGAVTAVTLEADLVLGSRIIAGDPAGARVEIHPTAGIQSYLVDGVTRTSWIDASTGAFTAVGTIATAFSGQRITINPGGTAPDTIRFYPSSGTAYASIDSITSGANYAGIMMYGASAGTKRGIILAREDYASLVYANSDLSQASIQTDIFASPTLARVRSGAIEMVIDETNPATPKQLNMSFWSSPNTIRTGTVLSYGKTGIAGGEPQIWAGYRDVGFVFTDNVGVGLNTRIYVTANNIANRRDLAIYSLLYFGDLVKDSSQYHKRDIAVAQDLDPRQATRNARAKYFRKNPLDEGPVYDNDGNQIRGPREAPLQLGFIAEEMPEQVQTMVSNSYQDGQDVLGISLDAMVTMLWQGQGELADKFDLHGKSPKYLPEVTILPDPPATGATLYVFAGSVYAVMSTGKRIKMGQ